MIRDRAPVPLHVARFAGLGGHAEAEPGMSPARGGPLGAERGPTATLNWSHRQADNPGGTKKVRGQTTVRQRSPSGDAALHTGASDLLALSAKECA